MSWGPQNLQALLKLSHSPPQHLQQSFKRSPLTLYQQKWLSKRMLRGYHGDWIQERRLRRRFMPDSLPPLEASSSSSSAASATPTNERNTRKNSDYNARTAKSGQAPDRRIPLASLMWREVEARLDVLLFRACLAYSAREARRLVTQGHVKLNGKKVCLDLR